MHIMAFMTLYTFMDALKRILELGDVVDTLDYMNRMKHYIGHHGLPPGIPDWVEEHVYLIETLVILEVKHEAHEALCNILTFMKATRTGSLLIKARLMRSGGDVGVLGALPLDVRQEISSHIQVT